MNKIVSIALIACGIALLLTGLNASNSIGSDFSRLFTGSPTDKAIWLFVGGCVVTAIGIGGLLRSSRTS